MQGHFRIWTIVISAWMLLTGCGTDKHEGFLQECEKSLVAWEAEVDDRDALLDKAEREFRQFEGQLADSSNKTAYLRVQEDSLLKVRTALYRGSKSAYITRMHANQAQLRIALRATREWLERTRSEAIEDYSTAQRTWQSHLQRVHVCRKLDATSELKSMQEDRLAAQARLELLRQP